MTRPLEIDCKLTHCALSTSTPWIARVGDVEGGFAGSEAGALAALATKLRELADQADARAAKARRRDSALAAPVRHKLLVEQASQEGGAA